MKKPLVLVTGASGYIGGRLVPALLAAGYAVRAMSRDLRRLDKEPWRAQVEVVAGDALDPRSLKAAAAGVEYAFYLIHSMDGSGNFSERDSTAARNFADAADEAGMKRIVYLGGLGKDDDELSPHLTSRQEVGKILASGGTPVTELRAAVIIGSGSVSFEMLRYLTEVLPVMTTPSWVRTRCQPVAISDALTALVSSLDDGSQESAIRDLGGPDVLTYQEMMQGYAEVAGLKRRLIMPIPVLSPRLSSLWVGLVTPLPVGVARPLIDSLRNEVVVSGARSFQPKAETSYREAVALALKRTAESAMATRWSDSAWPAAPLPTDPAWSGGTVLSDLQQVDTSSDADSVFAAVSRIGGENGYYSLSSLWRLRGLLDKAIGGVGLRQGRRHPTELRVGEALDFWRVVDVVPGSLLRLQAEMKLPGVATLEWRITPTASGARLVQEARFVPRGLLGRFYWYALWPVHVVVFGRMARLISRASRRQPLAAL
ncbi:MAG: SDR family oxidoreductase [Acidimicrobiia bacterium]|nr:SDR family oxidoreductase [Acidimicrobiia bacterium]